MLTYADALALQQLLALPQLHGRGERQVVNSLTLPLAPPIRPPQARHAKYVLVYRQIRTVLSRPSVLTLPTFFFSHSSASDSPRPSRHTEETLGPARSGSQTAAQASSLLAAERGGEHPLSGAWRLAKEVCVGRACSSDTACVCLCACAVAYAAFSY